MEQGRHGCRACGAHRWHYVPCNHRNTSSCVACIYLSQVTTMSLFAISSLIYAPLSDSSSLFSRSIGSLIVSGSNDHTLRIWLGVEQGDERTESFVLEGHKDRSRGNGESRQNGHSSPCKGGCTSSYSWCRVLCVELLPDALGGGIVSGGSHNLQTSLMWLAPSATLHEHACILYYPMPLWALRENDVGPELWEGTP